MVHFYMCSNIKYYRIKILSRPSLGKNNKNLTLDIFRARHRL